MSVAEPFDSMDAEHVIDAAVRLFWDAEMARGTEVIDFDDLDPVRRNAVRQHVTSVAPFLIRALKDALLTRTPVIVPDVIPEYFFDDGSKT